MHDPFVGSWAVWSSVCWGPSSCSSGGKSSLEGSSRHRLVESRQVGSEGNAHTQASVSAGPHLPGHCLAPRSGLGSWNQARVATRGRGPVTCTVSRTWRNPRLHRLTRCRSMLWELQFVCIRVVDMITHIELIFYNSAFWFYKWVTPKASTGNSFRRLSSTSSG